MLRSQNKIDKVECKEPKSHSSDSVHEDQLTLAELLRSRKKIDKVECIEWSNGRNSSSPCQRPLSLTMGIGGLRCVELSTTFAGKLKPCEVVIGGSKGSIQDVIGDLTENPVVNNNCSPDHRTVGFNERERDGNSYNLMQSSDLDAPVGKLERLVAKLKAAKSDQKDREVVTTCLS